MSHGCSSWIAQAVLAGVPAYERGSFVVIDGAPGTVLRVLIDEREIEYSVGDAGRAAAPLDRAGLDPRPASADAFTFASELAAVPGSIFSVDELLSSAGRLAALSGQPLATAAEVAEAFLTVRSRWRDQVDAPFAGISERNARAWSAGLIGFPAAEALSEQLRIGMADYEMHRAIVQRAHHDGLLLAPLTSKHLQPLVTLYGSNQDVDRSQLLDVLGRCWTGLA